ncbi:MAG: hypothetical protein ABUL65_01135, partial [Opitutus sp.]
MHTLIITAGGLSLLSLILGLAKDRGAAARRFIPFWGLISFLHLGYGVGVHHYGFLEELGVHVIVFGVPAAAAYGVGRAQR